MRHLGDSGIVVLVGVRRRHRRPRRRADRGGSSEAAWPDGRWPLWTSSHRGWSVRRAASLR